MPNWNRRWFILIGGTLYYASAAAGGSSAAAAAAQSTLQVFAQLEKAQGVELVDKHGFSNTFRIIMGEGQHPLQFAAPTASERLRWVSEIEGHLGMEAVPLQILQTQLKKEGESGKSALRIATLSAELGESESEVLRLRELVAQLQAALEEKDKLLWRLVAEQDLSVASELPKSEPAKPTRSRHHAKSHDHLGSMIAKSASDREGPTQVAPKSTLQHQGSLPTMPVGAARSPSPFAKRWEKALDHVREGAYEAPRDAPPVPVERERSGKEVSAENTRGIRAVGRLLSAHRRMEKAVGDKGAMEKSWHGSTAHMADTAASAQQGDPSVQASPGGHAATIGHSVSSHALCGGGGKQPPSSPQLAQLFAQSARNAPAQSASSGSFLGSTHNSTHGSKHGANSHGGTTLPQTPTQSPQSAPPQHAQTQNAQPQSAHGAQGPKPNNMQSFRQQPLTVRRFGHLTKLSKGGFTTNWNRRAFALIGSSLYYERDFDTLAVQPKLFTQLQPTCEIVSWAAGTSPHNNVFAIRFDPESDQEMLLLAADTPIDKFGWMEALTKACNEQPCPVARVAPLLSMLSLESTQRNVLQSQIEDAMLAASSNSRGPGAKQPHPHSHAADLVARHDGKGGRDDPPSPGMSWILDRFVPDIFKNL